MNVKVALTCDLNGSLEQLTSLCNVLEEFEVRGTFLVSPKLPAAGKGSYGGRPDEETQFKLLMDKKHEVCSHTYSHPFDMTSLSTSEMESNIISGHEALVKSFSKYDSSFTIRGFRAPAQVFDERAFPVFEKLGYGWDSSQVYFPTLGKPFEPSLYGSIVEIPVLFPNDSALLDKYRLTTEKEESILKEVFDASRKYFVFTVHPFCTARNEENLAVLHNLLKYMRNQKSEFLTLSELAEDIKKSEAGNLRVAPAKIS
ncbi:MAG: polysaccharide deacetylase family protein [Nitrososphaerales archaeon]